MTEKSWDGQTERRKENAIIHETLIQIKLDLASIKQFMQNESNRNREDYQRHQESLERMDHTLYGNAKEGLTTTAKRTSDSVAAVAGELSSHGIRDNWAFSIMGSMLLGILGIVVSIFLRQSH